MGWENPHGILGLVAAREGAVPLCCPTLPSPPAALAARSARLVFHTADTCTQRGQPRAHTRAALLGANALAAGPQAVVPPRALLAPGWEEQSCSDVLSVATSPGDVCWAQGAAGCRGPHGKRAPPLTLPRAAPGSLLQPGLCAAASMTAGAPGAAQNSCPHSPPLPGRRQLSHDSVLRPGAAGGSCHPAAVLSPLLWAAGCGAPRAGISTTPRTVSPCAPRWGELSPSPSSPCHQPAAHGDHAHASLPPPWRSFRGVCAPCAGPWGRSPAPSPLHLEAARRNAALPALLAPRAPSCPA